MTDEKFPKELSQAAFGALAQSLEEKQFTPMEITKDVFMLRDEDSWAYYRRPILDGLWKRIQHGKNG